MAGQTILEFRFKNIGSFDMKPKKETMHEALVRMNAFDFYNQMNIHEKINYRAIVERHFLEYKAFFHWCLPYACIEFYRYGYFIEELPNYQPYRRKIKHY